MRAIVGEGPKVGKAPRFVLNTVAWWQERSARRNGTDAPITRDLIADVWGKHLAYDSSKSQKELGMTYRPADAVLRDAIAWLLQQGALPPKVAEKAHAGMARTA